MYGLQARALLGVDPNLKRFMDLMGELIVMIDTGEIEPPYGRQLQDENEELNISLMDVHFWINWKQILTNSSVAAGCLVLTIVGDNLLLSHTLRLLGYFGSTAGRTITCHFIDQHQLSCFLQTCHLITISSRRSNGQLFASTKRTKLGPRFVYVRNNLGYL